MTITNGACLSFKLELFQGIHDFTSDTFKMALYDETADLGPLTPAYTTIGECVGVGYTPGGVTLTVSAGYPQIAGGTLVIDYDDVVFGVLSVSTSGALIYNASKDNRAVQVLSFGSPQSINANFTLALKPPSSTQAIMRL